jgi:hypothetical protein
LLVLSSWTKTVRPLMNYEHSAFYSWHYFSPLCSAFFLLPLRCRGITN